MRATFHPHATDRTSLLALPSSPAQTDHSAHESSGVHTAGHSLSMERMPTAASPQPRTGRLAAMFGRSPLLTEWGAWAKQYAPGEARQEALAILKSWLAGDRRQALSLFGLGLTTLPDRFPEGVRQLALERNRLTSLPETLPDSLELLKVDHNQLTALPSRLPPKLRELQASNNRLSALPALPEGLEAVDAAWNRLISLPDRLPERLTFLFLNHNSIECLPSCLPANLRRLALNGNRLSALPDPLPGSLEHVRLDGNRFSSVPQSLLALPAACYVELEDNPFSPGMEEQLAVRLRSPGYSGPGFDLFSRSASLAARARPLSAAVADWLDSPKNEVLAAWQAFENEEGAGSFVQFLDSLNSSPPCQDAAFRSRVAIWLDELVRRPDLRKSCFQISVDATSSCADRVALAFNDMAKAHLSHDVDDGLHDGKIAELIDKGRIMFRLDMLEKIARAKATALLPGEKIDEIEIYLAYQVKLRDALSLPLYATSMRYFQSAKIDDHDLVDALKTVQQAELTEFSGYLALDWAPWQALLRRLAPQETEQAAQDLADAIEQTFEKRLAARLAGTGLEDDPDARRMEGVRLGREMGIEIWEPVTRRFLSGRGLAASLASGHGLPRDESAGN